MYEKISVILHYEKENNIEDALSNLRRLLLFS